MPLSNGQLLPVRKVPAYRRSVWEYHGGHSKDRSFVPSTPQYPKNVPGKNAVVKMLLRTVVWDNLYAAGLNLREDTLFGVFFFAKASAGE